MWKHLIILMFSAILLVVQQLRGTSGGRMDISVRDFESLNLKQV